MKWESGRRDNRKEMNLGGKLGRKGEGGKVKWGGRDDVGREAK